MKHCMLIVCGIVMSNLFRHVASIGVRCRVRLTTTNITIVTLYSNPEIRATFGPLVPLLLQCQTIPQGLVLLMA